MQKRKNLMASFPASRFRKLRFLAVIALAALPCGARGQQPGPEPRVIGAARNDLIEVEEAVDILALPRDERLLREFKLLALGRGDKDEAGRQLEKRLQTRIDQIDRVCKLSAEQRNKLSVAGRGDIRRVFAELEELSTKMSSRDDVRAPLHRVVREQMIAKVVRFRESVMDADRFGDGSLFSKVLRNTLSPEQVAVREKAVKDAATAQHRSTIRWAIGSMEPWLQLSQEQRDRLESLLSAKTRPPRKFGAYDYYGLMFQASKLPEQELKSIFNDAQWQKVQQQIAESRRLEQTLRVGGFVPDDDVADIGAARQIDPISKPAQPRC
jgi:hypothetical protein